MGNLLDSPPDSSIAEGAEHCREVTRSLLEYCQSRDWAGYDPYDALNSRIFQALGLERFRWAGLCVTQAVKRSPINLRPLLSVPPAHNPKGIALFISALLNLRKHGFGQFEDELPDLLGKLRKLRSPDVPFWCWGYHFPWQSRAALFPRWIPNVICTTFAGNALLDAFEEFGDREYLEMAVSAADFILAKLYHEQNDGIACISYMPLARSRVHNANLLGAAFLCRIAKISQNDHYSAPALKCVRYSVGKQHPDGSWDYGDSDNPPQRWKDNFHTGYNLCALDAISRYAETTEFHAQTQLGYQFYKDHFFRHDGAPKYFDSRDHPFDIHSVAQSLITFATFRHLDPANSQLSAQVLNWGIKNLWSGKGYFYFQQHRFYTNRTPFMRWSQAWMLLALSQLSPCPSRGRNEAKQEHL